MIGTGTPIASINGDAVDWSAEDKSRRVDIDFSGTCSNFTLLSNQKLNYTPFSYSIVALPVRISTVVTSTVPETAVYSSVILISEGNSSQK